MSDLISRQAAIDAVKECAYEIDGYYCTYDRVIREDDAIEVISILPSAQLEPQWIPCSERLPETKTAYYLVTIANYGRFFTTTLPDNVETVRWDYDRRKGLDSWHWCTERTVTAWMPLPEPYREKGD